MKAVSVQPDGSSLQCRALPCSIVLRAPEWAATTSTGSMPIWKPILTALAQVTAFSTATGFLLPTEVKEVT